MTATNRFSIATWREYTDFQGAFEKLFITSILAAVEELLNSTAARGFRGIYKKFYNMLKERK
jgi:hypothetical protein